MPSTKPRIVTYTTPEDLEKFKVIAKEHNRSMSNFLTDLIAKTIKEYEKENGPIPLPQNSDKEPPESAR